MSIYILGSFVIGQGVIWGLAANGVDPTYIFIGSIFAFVVNFALEIWESLR